MASPSLEIIPYERAPFRDHIAALMSVINANKEEDLNDMELHIP